MRPYRVRIEYGKTEPGKICIVESATPEITWAVAAEGGERQEAVRAELRGAGRLLWNTGWLTTDEQSLRYAGEPLPPGEVCRLNIRLRSSNDEESEVYRELCFGGLAEWPASWIGEQEERRDAVLTFIRDIHCAGVPASACLYVCGLGYHRVTVNGRQVFGMPLNPAYSEYEKRCYYTVLPGLENVLTAGKNRIGIDVAAGWRDPQNVCYELTKRIPDYTGSTQLSAALRLRYADGREEWICTGRDWHYFYGPITCTNIFTGERFEAGRRVEGWCLPGKGIPGLVEAAELPPPGGQMLPQAMEPVAEQEVYRPVSIISVAEGVLGVDFGQNIAGVCRIRIPRDIPEGCVIEISHMEFLGEDGRLYRAPLRNASSVDTYVAVGGGRDPEFWQPAFTFHGFRYAEVRGYPGPLLQDEIEAVSLYMDIASGSRFTCGSALVEKIQRNVVQTEKSNLHSILSDCPQRDERMGWLNDSTVRFEETPYNFDIGRLFPKVVRDCLDVQGEGGEITCTAPFAFGARPADPVCSSFLIAGWMAYLHTGNVDILREAYPGFCAWNNFLESQSDDGIVQYSYYGDWAGPAYACVSEEFAVSAVTPGTLMSTGYFYYNACLLAKIAGILGRKAEAEEHRKKAATIRHAFLNKWWNGETGVVGTGSQGCQAFALWLDILPEEGRQKAADHLHEDLVAGGYRQTTGNLCTRYMMETLSRFGYVEDAWTLITREEYPSLGYMIQNEATTIWERFELKKDPTMNSYNHPMYGAVGYWFYACLTGLKPLGPAWRKFEVAPVIPQKLLSASAVLETPFGDILTRWVKRYGELHLYLDVPPGTRAQVYMPWGTEETVEGGYHHWSNPL